MAPLLFSIFGGVVMIAVIIMLSIVVRKAKHKKLLAAYGEVISANSVESYLDSSESMNGQNPYRIRAQWQNPRDGKIYTFSSEAIWFDPAQYLVNKTINVRIDPRDPRIYQMDTGFLPHEA